MGEILSTLGGRVVDAGFAAILLSGLITVIMLTTRQPSRRRSLARAGVLGSLLCIPFVWIRLIRPFEVVEPLRTLFKPTWTWISLRLGLNTDFWKQLTSHFPPRYWRYMPIVLLGMYLLGVLAGLFRLILGFWGAGWIGRNSIEASDEAIALYDSMVFAPRRPKPALRVSTRTRRPVLLGTFRETILIPTDLDLPESLEQLRLSLLHELAHAEASDPWFGVVSELTSVFWFPLPTLWWIRRQMRLDQEFLADRHAAARFGAASHYASSLVDIAASPSSGSPSLGNQVKGSDAGSALFQRVLMLVRCPFPVEGQPPTWWTMTLMLGSTVLLFGVTSLTINASALMRAAVQPPEPRSFSMGSLVLDESPTTPGPTTLPIRLNPSFNLTFRVFANQKELSQIIVLGHPLSADPLVKNTLLKDEPRWRNIKMTRSKGLLTLQIDDEPGMAVSDDSKEEWVTLRPIPGQRTTFRSFLVTW
jgi:beta-lactamase regulating signal transducer with metallopeptidase domain